MLFGEDALRYFIIVFSKCNREYTVMPPQTFKGHWNDEIFNLVNAVGNRWAISPNPEIFSPGESIFEEKLKGLRKEILSIHGKHEVQYLQKHILKQRMQESGQILGINYHVLNLTYRN